MTPLTIAAIIAAAVGLLFGVAIRQTALRRGSTPAEASRNWRFTVSGALLLGAALLGYIAVTEDHLRYLNLAIVAFMVVTALWELSRLMRTRQNPE